MEFVTTTAADTSVQETEVPSQEAIDTQAPHIEMEKEAIDTQEPPMNMLAPTITETSTTEPIVSQAYIESQIRQSSKSLTSSMDSMFEKLNQSVEYKFQNLSKEINQLKARMDLYDLTTMAPHDV